MSVNGIWSSEIQGPYGWESIGTTFLKDGRLMGGGPNHYSIGTYKESDDGSLTFHIDITQFGKKRTLFGRKKAYIPVIVKVSRKGDRMQGEATLPGQSQYSVQVRYKRRADLPK